MTRAVFILNGPNLNLLGLREPHIYGRTSLADIEAACRRRGATLGFVVDFRQSNAEADLIGWVHEARTAAVGVIINAGAYTHTSIALLDALLAAEIPVIEVHISNIFRREPFRHHSYISAASTGMICGCGAFGYELALEALAEMLARASRDEAAG
jgi:3-dehydroquinate dehydratase-2